MRRIMITVSAALALMLSMASCKDKTSEETTPATSTTTSFTTEAVNVTTEATTVAPVTTLAEATTAAPVTTLADETTVEKTVAPEVSIPLTAKYFPDEAFLQLVSGFDRNKDGVLSPGERMSVEEVRFYNSISYSNHEVITHYPHGHIHSLEGIQYFPALTLLDCSHAGLTELDVSHNHELIHLYCQDNKLTTLDLSKNEALEVVDCYSNQLTSLDLKANQNLRSINCVDNSLSELNISGLSKLGSVNCFCNPYLKINANDCSSGDGAINVVKFAMDATASISSNSNADGSTIFRIEKRYDHAPIEDGYYYADLIEKEEIDYFTQLCFQFYGLEYGSFTGATADHDLLTLRDARLSTNPHQLDYYYSYDCGTISLPLAHNVKYQYANLTYDSEKNVDIDNDFNTFYSAMLKEYHGCFSEYTTGGLELIIHILNGSIDEITIQIIQYP